MSKGYADYLVALAREIDREFQRDAEGIEVPLFKNKYLEWLKTEGKISEQSQVNYNHWLEKTDAYICESDYDFWTLLQKAWVTADFEDARKLCKEYENKLLDEKARVIKEGEEGFGVSAKEIGNWVSAFRKYCVFIEDQMQKAEADKKLQAAMIEESRRTADHLFLDIRFILWGISNGLNDSTMESYVSYIKRVNRELFCKSGHNDLHEKLPQFVKAKDEVKIDELFTKLDNEIAERIDNLDETEMPVVSLKNCRSALSKYAEFIKSITVKD